MASERSVLDQTSCELLTVQQVSQLLKVSVRSVWRLATAGQLPKPVRLSAKLVRWRRVDLERHLAGLAGEPGNSSMEQL